MYDADRVNKKEAGQNTLKEFVVFFRIFSVRMLWQQLRKVNMQFFLKEILIWEK